MKIRWIDIVAIIVLIIVLIIAIQSGGWKTTLRFMQQWR